MARNVLTVAAMVAAGTAMADPYALTMGDRLAISLVGAEQTYEIEVDIDGQIRFVDVGGIVVAGLTLDATEAVIEDAIEAAREGKRIETLLPDVQDGMMGMRFIDACVRSSKKNAGWVSL